MADKHSSQKNATRYRTEETKLKYKNTCLERYGVDNYSKTEKDLRNMEII